MNLISRLDKGGMCFGGIGRSKQGFPGFEGGGDIAKCDSVDLEAVGAVWEGCLGEGWEEAFV